MSAANTLFPMRGNRPSASTLLGFTPMRPDASGASSFDPNGAIGKGPLPAGYGTGPTGQDQNAMLQALLDLLGQNNDTDWQALLDAIKNQPAPYDPSADIAREMDLLRQQSSVGGSHPGSSSTFFYW